MYWLIHPIDIATLAIDLFSTAQLLSDVSGAGNNWAHGFYEYGGKYQDLFLELVRSQAEPCDRSVIVECRNGRSLPHPVSHLTLFRITNLSLQSFFLMHSLGGGTGSGLGTRLLELLADNYGGTYR